MQHMNGTLCKTVKRQPPMEEKKATPDGKVGIRLFNAMSKVLFQLEVET